MSEDRRKPDSKQQSADKDEARRDDARKDDMRTDTDTQGKRPARREKDVVTEGSEDSFPASDPPSYMGGSAISGSPPRRKTDDGDDGEASS